MGRSPATPLVRTAGLREGENIFQADLSAAAERLLALPQIEEAKVTRRLPDTLVIEVRERRPVAWVAGPGAPATREAALASPGHPPRGPQWLPAALAARRGGAGEPAPHPQLPRRRRLGARPCSPVRGSSRRAQVSRGIRRDARRGPLRAAGGGCVPRLAPRGDGSQRLPGDLLAARLRPRAHAAGGAVPPARRAHAGMGKIRPASRHR